MAFNIVVFLLGIVGGALAELLKWYQMRESPNLPVYARSPLYWIITVLMMLAGGVLALVQGVDAANPLLALNVGISAPLILKGLAAAKPPEPSRTTYPRGAEPSIIDFLAGR
jgi:hypothetical protein